MVNLTNLDYLSPNFDTPKLILTHHILSQKISDLTKLAKESYFFPQAKKDFIDAIYRIRSSIDLNLFLLMKLENIKKIGFILTVEQLENNFDLSKKLTRVFEIFSKNCLLKEVEIDKTYRHLKGWTFDLRQELLKRKNQLKLREFNLDQLKEKKIIPNNLLLKTLSKDELYILEKKLKEILIYEWKQKDIFILEAVWWEEYCRLLPFLQKIRIDCKKHEGTFLTYSLEKPEVSKSLMSLFLGSFDPMEKDGLRCAKNPLVFLSFMIWSLDQMLCNGEIPADEKERVLKKLNSYQAAYRIGVIHEEQLLCKLTDPKRTEDVIIAKNICVNAIIRELETNQFVTISSGYSASPSGHEVVLNFYIEVDLDGNRMVKGRVFNRGEGIEFHGPIYYQGLKCRINSQLELSPVNLETLKKCPFFELLCELQVPKLRLFDSHLDLDPRTHYTIRDFYDVALATWPGEIKRVGGELLGLQIGTTCIAAYIYSLKTEVSSALYLYIKLKMRIEALELFFINGTITLYSIPLVQGMLKKINRLLKKLEVQNLKGNYNWLEQNLHVQKKFVHLLTRKINEKLKQIQNLQSNALIFSLFSFSDIEIQDTRLRAIQIKKEKKVNETENYRTLFSLNSHLKRFKRPEEVVEFIKIFQLNDGFLTNNKNSHFYETIVRKFLQALPTASNHSFWSHPLFVSQDSLDSPAIYIIFSLLEKLDQKMRQEYREDTLASGELVITQLNVITGILIALKASHQFDETYIQNRAARILEILRIAIPQLRTGMYRTNEFLDQSIQELKLLSNCLILPPLNFNKLRDGSVDRGCWYGLESHQCETMEQIQKDVVIYDFYKKMVGEKTIEKGLQLLLDDDDKTLILSKILMNIYNPLILNIGFSGPKSVAEVSNIPNFSNKIPTSHEMILKWSFSYRCCPSKGRYGVMTDQLFRWEFEDRMIVQELLDCRLRWRNVNERKTQNEHIRASRKSVKFAGTILSSQEIERLLSITSHPESFISQIIHCFSEANSFYRLHNLRFCALLQGFLLTKNDRGRPLLRENFENGGPLMITSLVHFIQHGIRKAKEYRWFEPHFFLMLLLAQVIDHIPSCKPLDNLIQEALKQLYQEMIELCDQPLSPKKKNISNHWLLAIYPLIANIDGPYREKTMLICKNIALEFEDRYLPYRFHSSLIEDLFQKSRLLLSENLQPKPLAFSLPLWVFKQCESILKDFEPQVTFLKTGEFEFLTNRQIKYRIQLGENKQITIYRDFEFERGKITSYYYVKDYKLLLSKTPLTENTQFWINEETFSSENIPQMLIIDPSNDAIKGKILNGEIVHSENPQLILASADVDKQPFIQRIAYLDELDQVLIWKDQKTHIVSRIEFPRLKLTFLKSKRSWTCPEQKNWEIDLFDSINELNPYTHFILLKSGKNQKKILVTNKMTISEKPVFSSHAREVRSSISPKVFIFCVNNSKQLESPSEIEPLLYLIHLALGTNQYSRALQLIRKLNSFGKMWNEDAKAMFEIIIADRPEIYKDNSLYACCLRLLLRINLLKSEPFTELPFNLTDLINDYKTCLNQPLNNHWWISESDEKLLIRWMEIKPFYLLTVRIHELSHPQKRSNYKSFRSHARKNQDVIVREFLLRKESIPLQDTKTTKWITKSISQKMIACCEKPEFIPFLTRPGEPFIYNFLYYYKVLDNRVPNQEFEQVVNLLTFCQYGTDPKIELFRRWLWNFYLETSKSSFPQLKELLILLEKNETGLCPNDLIREASLSQYNDKIHSFQFLKKVKASNQFLQKPTPKQIIELISSDTILFPTDCTFKLTNETLDLTKALANAGLIQLQDTRASIIHERSVLRTIQEQLTAKGMVKTRLLEGLDEHILELDELLKKSCQQYILSVDESRTNHESEINPRLISKNGKTVDFLNELLKQLENKLNPIQNQIETLANRRSEKTMGDVASEIGKAHHITLRDLILFFGRGDEGIIPEMNSELTDAQLSELKELVTHYLVLKTDSQHIIRSQELLTNASKPATKEGESSSDALHAARSFVSSITQKRVYDPTNNIRLLVFEYLSEIRLRQDQYEALQKLNSSNSGDFELEARTGFGKTKVIVPLWLLLNNQSEKIITFTTTPSLMEDQIVFLRKALGETYEKTFHKIVFSKEDGSDLQYLTWFHQTLLRSKQKGGIVLLQTINTLHKINGLALKDQIFKSTDTNKQIELLLAIRDLYRNGIHFIDESAECFDVLHTYVYAKGSSKIIDLKSCERANIFFNKILLVPAILTKWNLEFLSSEQVSFITRSTDNVAQIPTEKNFELEFLPDVIQSVLTFFKISELNKRSVIDILMGRNADQAEEFLSTLNSDQAAFFIYCSNQIRIYLKKTILKMCGVRYAAGQSGLAIPLSEGVPNPKSEFGTTDDLINFTVQTNLKNPISYNNVKEYINYAVKHIQAMGIFRASKKSNLQQCLALIHSLKLSPFDHYSEDDMQLIAETINNTTKWFELRLQIICSTILPKIRSFPQRLCSNSYNLTDALGIIHCASGTINFQTLPPRIKSIELKSALVANVLSIWQKSSHEILTIPTINGIEFLSELLKKRPQDRVLTDIGGILRGISQKSIIDKIFELSTKHHWNPPVKGVVFYDDNRMRMVWEKDSDAPINHEDSALSIDDVFIYIRQAHAIGSDIPMPETARGSNTVSRETTERLLLQGLGRMRELSNGQVANFVITEEDAQVMRNEIGLEENTKITLPHLFIYAQKLEVRRKQKDYYHALHQYMINCIERQIWMAYDKKFIDQNGLIRHFHLLGEVLVESSEKDLMKKFLAKSEEVLTEEAIKRLSDNILKPVVELVESKRIKKEVICTAKIKEDFSRFVHVEYLPDKIIIGKDHSEDLTVEVEVVEQTHEMSQEVNQETEVTQEKETETEMEEILSAARNFVPASPIQWNGDYHSIMNKKPVDTILGIGIYLSPNMSIIAEDSVIEGFVRKPAYQFVLKIEESRFQGLMLLDLYDEKYARDFTRADRTIHKKGVRYFILSNHRIIGAKKEDGLVNFEELIVDTDMRAKIAILERVYSGADSFTEYELKWVMENLRKQSEEHRKQLVALLKKTAAVWPCHVALLQTVSDYC